MNKPTMTGGNPCEAHLNIKTGGYCPICMGEELDNLKELNREMVGAMKQNCERCFKERDLDRCEECMFDKFINEGEG